MPEFSQLPRGTQQTRKLVLKFKDCDKNKQWDTPSGPQTAMKSFNLLFLRSFKFTNVCGIRTLRKLRTSSDIGGATGPRFITIDFGILLSYS